MEITKFVRRHSYAREHFQECMKSMGVSVKQLQLAGKTRWGSTVLCISRVLYARAVFPVWLQDATVNKLFKKKASHRTLRQVMLDNEFFETADIICKALSPLCVLITLLEGDYANLSFAWHQLTVFEKYLKSTELADCYPEILKYYRSRKQFAFCDVVALANLLDPRYRGMDLSNEEKINARKLLVAMSGNEILSELQEFLVKSSRTNKEIFIESLISDPLVWWEATGGLYYPKLRLCSGESLIHCLQLGQF
jgi:hypothetical protein